MIAAIADDITGAAEIAGVCLRLGVPVFFSLDVKRVEQGVLVIATDTRSMKVTEAIQKTEVLVGKLCELGVSHIFKKTDSVLRGHVAQELEVTSRYFSTDKVLLVPANPYTQRNIVGGQYYVKGKPLDQTDFKEDPEFPAHSSYIKDLLHPNSLSIHDGDRVDLKRMNPGITVPDCSTMEDLISIAGFLTRDTLPAGSGAFFEAYLRTQFQNLCGLVPHQAEITLEGSGLLVAGSNHFQTHDFIKKARRTGVKVSEMPKMLKIQEIHHSKLEDWSEDINFLLEKHGKVILTAGKIQVRFDDCANILKDRMTISVAKVIAENGIQELLVSGGATVYAIISRLNWRSFEPLAELSPGVVRLQEKTTGCYLTIKPGSYDWPAEILRYFELQPQSTE